MRISKAIREYVEDEINQKYEDKLSSFRQDYKDEKKAVKEKLQEILDEANRKAEDYLQSVGYKSYRFGSFTNGSFTNMFTWEGSPCKPEIEKEIENERRSTVTKRCAKIKQVLFDLEMGETAKAELKDFLDNLEID